MRKLLPWFAVLAILIVTFGTIYVVVQQTQRRAANNPQIQMAQDTAAALDGGDVPSVLSNGHVDIAKSLAPFTVIYDKNGKPVGGDGYYNGKLPAVDIGVLSNSQGKDYNAVTWDLPDGVRQAAVSVSAKKYYVLSARSLKEVEITADAALWLILLGWFVSVLLLALIFVLNVRYSEDY